MDNDNKIYEDAESFSYNSKDTLTFKMIILQHLKKISQLASVEFFGGYWKEIPTPNGIDDKHIYVPDTREPYSNAVECFADLLYPHFDQELKEKEDKIRQQIKQKYSQLLGEELILVDTKIIRHFREFKLELNKELFRELCSFLYRKKYLELGSIED